MFGLKYRTLLARDIVEVLDNSPDPLSLKEIQQSLGYSNVITIQDICKELMEISEESYGVENNYLQFENKKRGTVKLNRFSTNLQTFYKEIFSKDVAFEIIFELIQKRSFSSIEFCLNHSISKSTLQRKIKLINDELTNYKVYITCSDNVKFKANEVNIRLFSFYFLWATHREFSNVSWNLDTSYFLNTASSILDYLNISKDPVKTELTAFIVYIFWNAHSKKKKLNLTRSQQKILNLLNFPERPSMLSTWRDEEWKMFIVSLSNYNAYSPNFAYEQDKIVSQLGINLKDFNYFEQAICTHFGHITAEKYSYLHGAWLQYRLFIDYFDYPNVFVESLTHVFTLDSFSEEHPAYLNKFEHFWEDFLGRVVHPEKYESMRSLALLLCLNTFPLSANLLNSCIYLTSDVSELFNNYLKERILFRYEKKYNITFVNCFDDADLIISTVPLRIEQLNKGQKNITLSAHLREKDFSTLDSFFLNISNSRSEEI